MGFTKSDPNPGIGIGPWGNVGNCDLPPYFAGFSFVTFHILQGNRTFAMKRPPSFPLSHV